MVKPPAFLRILMMSVGADDGDGAGESAAEVVVVEWKRIVRRSESVKRGKLNFIITMFERGVRK